MITSGAAAEGTIQFFDPITIPDYDVPFPLVDLIYRSRFQLEADNRR
jgi:hypothetical protein